MTLCKAISWLRRSKTDISYDDKCFIQEKCNVWIVQVHVEAPPIPLIKSKKDENSDKDFVKIRLRRDTMSEILDLYDFIMALFDNINPEEFLLLICNFNMTL